MPTAGGALPADGFAGVLAAALPVPAGDAATVFPVPAPEATLAADVDGVSAPVLPKAVPPKVVGCRCAAVGSCRRGARCCCGDSTSAADCPALVASRGDAAGHLCVGGDDAGAG
jgi:hypothetical protein